MARERRLGRGLEALLSQPIPGTQEEGSASPQSDTTTQPSNQSTEPERAPIELIERNPFQPRQEFDTSEIDQLCNSIQEHGLLQPLVVRKEGEKYQLIAGERRLRACTKLGFKKVAIRVIQADDRQLAEVAIIENLQRKDLNSIEKAAAFQQYLKRYECSQEDLAKRIGVDRSTVANLIRLLDLPSEVQASVAKSAISAGHARALLPLGDVNLQTDFCKQIISEQLSVRATEKLVKERLNAGPALNLVGGHNSPKVEKAKNPHLEMLEKEFRVSLGTKVDIKEGANKSGKIVIHFKGHEEFERIRDYLCETNLPKMKNSA